MRSLIVIAGVAIVAVATLVWMHRAPPPAGGARVVSPAHEVVRSSPEPRSETEAMTPVTVAEDRAERLVQDIERSLRSFDEQERESVFTDMLPELIARDAAAAGRLVERLDRGHVRDQLREHVAQKWAERDRAGAIGWVASLESDDERRLAAADVSTQLARSDPGAAIEVASQFGIGRGDGTVEHLAQTWAEADLPKALQWVQEQPAGPERDRMLSRIALVQATRDPAQAGTMVLTEMTPGPAQRDAALQIARAWATTDLEAARRWITELPDGELRTRGQTELTRAMKLSQ